jgi:hypothetical protein
MQEELDRRHRRGVIIFEVILVGSVIWFWLVLSKTTKDANRVRNWVDVPCLIKDVKIDVDPISDIANFFWVISYTYEYDGRRFTSSRYNIIEKNKVIGGKEKKEIIKARKAKQKVQEPYSVGGETVCFVNPENPSNSVLVREVRNKAIIKRLLLPGIVAANFLIALLRELWRRWFWY